MTHFFLRLTVEKRLATVEQEEIRKVFFGQVKNISKNFVDKPVANKFLFLFQKTFNISTLFLIMVSLFHVELNFVSKLSFQ